MKRARRDRARRLSKCLADQASLASASQADQCRFAVNVPDINGTPTFMLNGNGPKCATWDELKLRLQPELWAAGLVLKSIFPFGE
jgi:hypothetical protein